MLDLHCYTHKNAQTVHSVPYAPILYHTKHIVHTALTYHSLQTTPTTQYDIIHIVLCYTKRTALHIFITNCWDILRTVHIWKSTKAVNYTHYTTCTDCAEHILHNVLYQLYFVQTSASESIPSYSPCKLYKLNTLCILYTVEKQTISTLTIHIISQTLIMDCAR